MVTPEMLIEFKERMKLGDDEDANLVRILKASHQALYAVCGKRGIAEDELFKELVFERARYSYNDALEYFDDNFLSNINTMAIEKVLDGMDMDDDRKPEKPEELEKPVPPGNGGVGEEDGENGEGSGG